MKLDETRGQAPVFHVRWGGVRGSFPVPGPEVVHFGGNTSCVEVESGPYRVVFDCGTGAIGLGNRLASDGADPGSVLFLISHLHHDHTMGWPFFKPVYHPRARLHVYGPGQVGRAFEDVFESAFAHPFFPVPPARMPSARAFGTLEHGDVLTWLEPDAPPQAGERAGGLVVRVFRNRNHPNGGVLNYRIERDGRSIVMATDVEGSEGPEGDLVAFARGTDLLIHDAQYFDEEYETTTQGWGHSTWRMAADVAARAQVRRLVLYHHDPAHDDQAVEAMEKLAREKFARSISACEGLEVLV